VFTLVSGHDILETFHFLQPMLKEEQVFPNPLHFVN
jgi:hypothetical protein